MPPTGRLPHAARAGLLCLAVVGVVFAPAALHGAPEVDPSDLAAAVLAPGDSGAVEAWRPASPARKADPAAAVLALVAGVVAVVAVAGFASPVRRPPVAVTAMPGGRPPQGRAPPALLAV